MGVQEDHDVAHGFLLLPALANLGDALLADALDFLEKRRTFVDHLQRAFAEGADDFVGEEGTDTFDESGGKELFDTLGRVGGRGLHHLGTKLPAMLRIVAPGAGRFEILPGHDARHLADDRDQVLLPFDLNAQHREPVFRVVKGDTFHDAGQSDVHRRIL